MTQNSSEMFIPFFEQAIYRKMAIELSCEMLEQQNTTKVLRSLEELRTAKGFDHVFKMLRKYFKND